MIIDTKLKTILITITLLLAASCGTEGDDGVNCYDKVGDVNGDGYRNATDCVGDRGRTGKTGTPGTDGQDGKDGEDAAGELIYVGTYCYRIVYAIKDKKYIDNGNLIPLSTKKYTVSSSCKVRLDSQGNVIQST